MISFKNFNLRQLAIGLSIAAVSHTSFAAFTCTGLVKNLTMAPNGNVYTSIIDVGVSLNWQVLCNVGVASNSIDPQTCKAMYAMPATAAITEKKVVLWFDFAGTNPGACDATRFPAWSVLKYGTDWYFGPGYAN